MRTIIISILLTTLSFTFASAQKKEIATATEQVKSGKNLAQAETSMLKLLQKEENKDNPKIHRLLHASIQKQYELLNEKMYLKQNIDTAAMFLILNKAFSYAFMTDSIDQSFRKKNGEFLSKYLPNLYNGGVFFFDKKKFKEAYELFDTYISGKDSPLLENAKQDDKFLKLAAFRALCCGFRLGEEGKTLKYKELALAHKPGRVTALKYLAETYLHNDSTQKEYIETLNSGFQDFPCEEYFHSRLINHHIANNDLEDALEIVNRTIEKCPDANALYFIKANILLTLERFEECIAAADSTIAITNANPEIYYIAGMANLYHLKELKAEAEANNETLDSESRYLQTAMLHLEEYRKAFPDQKDKWATPLYHIYLELNKGEEFEEISKILKQK